MDSATSREDDDWELYNDDGFVFKRKKRHLDSAATAIHLTDADQFQEALQKQWRERKRNSLLRLKARYLIEIHPWDFLSNTLCDLEETTLRFRREQEQARHQIDSLLDSVGESMVDELLLQVEAQEAIIHNISNLCDLAEAMCHKQEQQLKQSLFDLPIWASPVEVMDFAMHMR